VVGLLQTFAVALNVSIGDAVAKVAGLTGLRFMPVAGSLLDDIWRVTIAQIAPILPYLLLVLVLIFRPSGLMGKRES
jgi:branched-chain amino acid transport system permease protein